MRHQLAPTCMSHGGHSFCGQFQPSHHAPWQAPWGYQGGGRGAFPPVRPSAAECGSTGECTPGVSFSMQFLTSRGLSLFRLCPPSFPPSRFVIWEVFEARAIVSFPWKSHGGFPCAVGRSRLPGQARQEFSMEIGSAGSGSAFQRGHRQFGRVPLAKVEPWLGKIQLGAEAQIQAARLRRAWHAVSLYYKTAEQDRSRVAIEDLDSLLGDTELRSATEAFWVRYKLRFPTEVCPSDAAVSRASREMSKRLLCVTSVWKVKTLQWQLGTSSKNRKLGEGLWTEEPDDEQPAPWAGPRPRRKTCSGRTPRSSSSCHWTWSCATTREPGAPRPACPMPAALHGSCRGTPRRGQTG